MQVGTQCSFICPAEFFHIACSLFPCMRAIDKTFTDTKAAKSGEYVVVADKCHISERADSSEEEVLDRSSECYLDGVQRTLHQ